MYPACGGEVKGSPAAGRSLPPHASIAGAGALTVAALALETQTGEHPAARMQARAPQGAAGGWTSCNPLRSIRSNIGIWIKQGGSRPRKGPLRCPGPGTSTSELPNRSAKLPTLHPRSGFLSRPSFNSTGELTERRLRAGRYPGLEARRRR